LPVAMISGRLTVRAIPSSRTTFARKLGIAACYLTDGLAQCGECHASRNLTIGIRQGADPKGALLEGLSRRALQRRA
jgi:hypothetical protein